MNSEEAERWTILRNLDVNASEFSVRESYLSNFNIQKVLLAKKRTGECAGFCWILFSSKHDKDAFELLNKR